MLRISNDAIDAIRNFFIEIVGKLNFAKWWFKRPSSRRTPIGLDSAVAASLCDAPRRLSGLINRASRRPQGDDYRLRAKRAWAARARKCTRQETATEPSTGSTPEFLKIEEPDQLR